MRLPSFRHEAAPPSAQGMRPAWWGLLALLMLALNLRSPLTAIAPVVGEIRAELGMGPAMAGLLTSIPVLCFGLLAPLASVLIGRVGIETSVMLTLAGTALGTVLRASDGMAGALAGTLLLGVSLTVGNIVSLMVIARDFQQHRGPVTGAYTAALNVGTMLTAALTAPLALLVGWRMALAFWMVLAVLAAGFWWSRWRRRAEPAAVSAPMAKATQASSSLWRRPLVWCLVMALATHLFVYYSLTAWLPAYLMEVNGVSSTQAGLMASVFQALALVGSFGVPVLARRIGLGTLLWAMGALWLVTPVWMLLAPGQWLGWSLAGGIAQGGVFVIVFMLIMQSATDLADNRRISAAVQGVGYSLAAAGPLVTGAVHGATGDWRVAFSLLAVLSLAVIASGWIIARMPAASR